MTNAVEMTKSFQDRIFEKIRNDIGSLMTDEDVKKLVESAIEREFFTKVKNTHRSSYNNDVYDPPGIQSLVKELVEPTLRKAIDLWLKEHNDEVSKSVETALAGGLSHAILKSFDYILQSAMMNLQNNITQALQLTKTY